MIKVYGIIAKLHQEIHKESKRMPFHDKALSIYLRYIKIMTREL